MKSVEQEKYLEKNKDAFFFIISKEKERQRSTINLIASENYASFDVMSACGSVLTNKYAEGYPHARYYNGCKYVDEIEELAITLGKDLFGAEYMNVQPHSGSSANFAVYLSLLNPGDTVLGMDLAAGGHLTHGYKINFSGKLYNTVTYGLSQETEMLDYHEIEKLALQHNPKMIIAGASAYSRFIDYKRFSDIARSVNAFLVVDMAHVAGLIAAKLHPNPIPFADVVTSTTHKTLRGPRGGIICARESFGKKIDRSIMPGSQGGPLMHVIAAKGIAFAEALQESFKLYQKQVLANAKVMAQTFCNLGYRVVSGGTDNHLCLIDVSSKHASFEMTGKKASDILDQCSISVNANLLPFDTKSPSVTSGIRVGTPAITTRGLKEKEVEELVILIDEALSNSTQSSALKVIKNQVMKIANTFPIYE